MGIVYEATHVLLEKRVALKILPVRPTMDANHLERFFREARTAAGLHHTNIVPVFDVGQTAGTPYDNSSNKKTTYQFKRLDDHTIEMIMNSELSSLKEVWQVHNNTLTCTAIYTLEGDRYLGGLRTYVSEYERIK